MENTPRFSHNNPNVAGGILIIAIGTMLLMKSIDPTMGFGVTWPIFVIAIGVITMHRRSGGSQ